MRNTFIEDLPLAKQLTNIMDIAMDQADKKVAQELNSLTDNIFRQKYKKIKINLSSFTINSKWLCFNLLRLFRRANIEHKQEKNILNKWKFDDDFFRIVEKYDILPKSLLGGLKAPPVKDLIKKVMDEKENDHLSCGICMED